MQGSARGKLILCGEHAVVYGHPAIAMPIDRTTTVTLTPSDGPTRWQGPGDHRATEVLRRLTAESGFTARASSDIPIGRGLGSSAALSVAIVRAMGIEDPEAQIEAAMRGEQVFHGNPSGLDVQVAVREAMIRFTRNEGFTVLPPPTFTVVVIDTGMPGDTAALVAGVGSRRPQIDATLDRIGSLVDEVAASLGDVRKMGPLLTENHHLLSEIGVSTPLLDDMVSLALDAGALGAKLSGAGGGGVVVALVEDPAPVLRAADGRGYSAFAVIGRPAGIRPQVAPK